MENKQIIKNMEYWKKKNNIPGIEVLDMAGLTDGRAGSSAFQMAEPGSSPNKGFGKFLKKAANVMTGGLAGGIGKAIKGDWKGALGSVASGGMSSFLPGGGGGGVAGALGGGGGGDDASAGAELLKEEAKAAMSGDSAVAMKKSPLEAEIPKGRVDEQGRPISTEKDAPKRKLTEAQKHDIAAEKLNTTGKWCATCGAHKDEHSGKDHAFKLYTPPGPDTKRAIVGGVDGGE